MFLFLALWLWRNNTDRKTKYTKSKEVLCCVVVSLFALSFWLGVKLFNFIKVYNYIYIVRCEHEGVVWTRRLKFEGVKRCQCGLTHLLNWLILRKWSVWWGFGLSGFVYLTDRWESVASNWINLKDLAKEETSSKIIYYENLNKVINNAFLYISKK